MGRVGYVLDGFMHCMPCLIVSWLAAVVLLMHLIPLHLSAVSLRLLVAEVVIGSSGLGTFFEKGIMNCMHYTLLTCRGGYFCIIESCSCCLYRTIYLRVPISTA
jgi:hypothetical protein